METLRVTQYRELSRTGAGPRFELEEAQAEVAGYTNAALTRMPWTRHG
jgi:hypothetical protein